MCGIVGFVDFKKSAKKLDIERMTEALFHRGPDDHGTKFLTTESCSIGLGHRRLSILDLSALGKQPMEFENLEMVYNGEVYNFKEIRTELIDFGYDFVSDSDTEILLKSYHKWGSDFVSKLNGMFAIAIHNKQHQTLTLLRDRAGVKPLYYYYESGLFVFGSEIKAFHEHPKFIKKINSGSVKEFLKYGYVPEPNSIFQNTYKLGAGQKLTLDLQTGDIKKKAYWSISDFYKRPKLTCSEDEALEALEKLMKNSFNYRMVSDVPVGVFLSGGYDSSLVTGIIQSSSESKINTFTIGFDSKEHNEAHFAKEIAEYIGTNHKELYCTQTEALSIIPRLSEIYDEPFGDPSAIPTILVSEMAKKDVTVCLSADGGDEVFIGYNKYDLCVKYFKAINKIPYGVRRTTSRLLLHINPKLFSFFYKGFNFSTKFYKALDILQSKNMSDVLEVVGQNFSNKQVDRLLLNKSSRVKTKFQRDYLGINNPLDQALALDFGTYMIDDVLVKVDRAAMSVGLEGREPLLDYRLIEYVAQIPSEMKYKGGEKKYLLKKIAHNYIPQKLIDRPKKGFSVPIDEWLRDELKGLLMEYLGESKLEAGKIFNVKQVVKLRNEFLKGKSVPAIQIWHILMFQMWYDKWMKE
jgi:asparagine synthase (glutamine-hydrolysing)